MHAKITSTVILIIISSLCSTIIPTLGACPAWGYDDTLPNGPSHWGTIHLLVKFITKIFLGYLCNDYGNCLGETQSPINFLDEEALQVNGDMSDLKYSYKQVNNVTVTNTRHTIEVRS